MARVRGALVNAVNVFYTKILIICKVGGGVISLLMFKPNGHKGPKDARDSRMGQLSPVPCSVLTAVFISRFFIMFTDLVVLGLKLK